MESPAAEPTLLSTPTPEELRSVLTKICTDPFLGDMSAVCLYLLSHLIEAQSETKFLKITPAIVMQCFVAARKDECQVVTECDKRSWEEATKFETEKTQCPPVPRGLNARIFRASWKFQKAERRAEGVWDDHPAKKPYLKLCKKLEKYCDRDRILSLPLEKRPTHTIQIMNSRLVIMHWFSNPPGAGSADLDTNTPRSAVDGNTKQTTPRVHSSLPAVLATMLAKLWRLSLTVRRIVFGRAARALQTVTAVTLAEYRLTFLCFQNARQQRKLWLFVVCWLAVVAVVAPPLILAPPISAVLTAGYGQQTDIVSDYIARLKNTRPYWVPSILLKAGAVDPLIAALKDTNSDVRSSAAEALGEIKDPRAVDPLIIAALKDTDYSVRHEAAEALGEIKDPRAVDPLIAALKDTDFSVRGDTAWALGEIKDPRAVDPLIAALKDTDSYVRGTAAGALGKIKDPRAVDPLVAALEDTNSQVRSDAAEALGKIKAPRALQPLTAALEDTNSHVRNKAHFALNEIKDWR